MERLTKDPSFTVCRADRPCGAPPLERLVIRPLTHREDFFVRCHGAVPRLDPAAWTLRVDGLVHRPLVLTLDDLARRYPRRDQVVTLGCACDPRPEPVGVAPLPGGVPWGLAAVGTARWSGFSLADVLCDAGVADGAADVVLEGLDEIASAAAPSGFRATVDLHRVLAGDVLLADRMNAAALPPEHGAPLRVIVPGFVGASGVKWLGRVSVRPSPDGGRGDGLPGELPAHAGTAGTDRCEGPLVEEMPLRAVICVPRSGTVVEAGLLEVLGYAVAGGHRRIARVEVSIDAGTSWTAAALLDRPAPGEWVRWRAGLTLAAGGRELIARAHDSSGARRADRPGRRSDRGAGPDGGWQRVMLAVR